MVFLDLFSFFVDFQVNVNNNVNYVKRQASAMTEVTIDYNSRKRVIKTLRQDLFKLFSFYKNL